MRSSPWSLPVVAALVWLAAASPAGATNGAIPTMVGARSPVSLPMEGDAQSFFRMPSGMAWSLESEIDLTLFAVYQSSTMRNSLNDFDNSGTSPGGSGGFLIAPLRGPQAEGLPAGAVGRFTYAGGLFVDIGGGASSGGADIRWQDFPETIDMGTGLLFLSATFSTSYAVTDWFSVGLGLNLLQVTAASETLFASSSEDGLAGSPQISGVPLPGSPTYSDLLNLFSTGEDSDPNTGVKAELAGVQFAPTLSFSLRPLQNLAIGFSYRPRSFVLQELEGSADVDATVTFNSAVSGLAAPIQQLFFATLPDGGSRGYRSRYDIVVSELYSPTQARLSIAWRPIPRLLLAGEVAWIEWHRAISTIEVVLTNGSNNDVNFVVGSDRVDTTLAQRWSNQWVFAFFAEFAVTDTFWLRTGWNYGRTPLNTERWDNSPTSAFVEHHVYLGFGKRWGRFSLDVLGELGIPRSENNAGLRATSATGRNSDYTSLQAFLHLGLKWHF